MPKRGESFMSMNGSPITAESKKIAGTRDSAIVSVPLLNGKVMELDLTAPDLSGLKTTLSKKEKAEGRDQLQALMDQLAAVQSSLL